MSLFFYKVLVAVMATFITVHGDTHVKCDLAEDGVKPSTAPVLPLGEDGASVRSLDGRPSALEGPL